MPIQVTHLYVDVPRLYFMHKPLSYRLICGQYVLYQGDEPQAAPTHEVAIAFSAGAGVLHTHGKPETVYEWAAKARWEFSNGAMKAPNQQARALLLASAADLTVIQGRFTLADLNHCLQNPDSLSSLLQRAKRGELPALDLLGNVTRKSARETAEA